MLKRTCECLWSTVYSVQIVIILILCNVGFNLHIAVSRHMSTVHPDAYICNLFIYGLSFNHLNPDPAYIRHIILAINPAGVIAPCGARPSAGTVLATKLDRFLVFSHTVSGVWTRWRCLTCNKIECYCHIWSKCQLFKTMLCCSDTHLADTK